jgi:hypothetical protein
MAKGLANADAIRYLLTVALLLALATFAPWAWFWAMLALATFSEAWALGYKFLRKP